jgi:2-polyprenyl-3-methyl-5-hydroxy-6-metoxy-1,4-benzoquinol methylase
MLPKATPVLDAGCGDGCHSLELARRFGFTVTGIDPIPRHKQIANAALAQASEHEASLADTIRFSLGSRP